VVIAIGGGAAWKLGLFSQSNTVPSLIGVSFKVFQNPSNPLTAQLRDDGFTVTANQHTKSASVPKDDIVAQSPAAGTSAKSGQVITVTISDGPVMVTVPTNLVGEDCATAISHLAALKIRAQCPNSAAVSSAVTPAGRIAKVLYQGHAAPATVPLRSTLVLAISTGKPAGSTSTTTTTVVNATTTTVHATTSTTTTTVASQPLVTMPNLVGMNRAQVSAAMHTAGLYYTTSGPGAGANPTWTKVVSQIPAAGTKVRRFSSVSLNVK
jgi:beta-lactam-binding protein with PASTA domain